MKRDSHRLLQGILHDELSPPVVACVALMNDMLQLSGMSAQLISCHCHHITTPFAACAVVDASNPSIYCVRHCRRQVSAKAIRGPYSSCIVGRYNGGHCGGDRSGYEPDSLLIHDLGRRRWGQAEDLTRCEIVLPLKCHCLLVEYVALRQYIYMFHYCSILCTRYRLNTRTCFCYHVADVVKVYRTGLATPRLRWKGRRQHPSS